MAKINISQQQSMHTFAEHANHIIVKTNGILSRVDASPVRQPESLTEIKAILQQCVGSIDELRQGREIKAGQLSDFEVSMKAFADG